ncbi:aromatic hydrocarbon degradation protein [Niabella sp.]|uniref:aromatic hydrocarbon degradation protein n=1 Tax=Niabella sp. TaxID=1962976 RepID=UPI00260774D1|nr:aromatic hydrocarbon degradation protein [Niabella sp.]
MKKIVFAAIALASAGSLFAQTPEDALRYSWLTSSGTARVQALGGASGSLGGEISTLFTNPGNLGFYKTGDLVISGGVNILNNKAGYFGSSNNTNKSTGFFGTSGVVFGNQSRGNGAVKSSALSIGVSRIADFNNNIRFGGLNTKSSMADMFMEFTNADNGRLDPYSSQMAYDVHWIADDANKKLFSPASALARNGGVLQEGSLRTNGGITEFSVGGGLNLNNTVYLGGAVGLPTLRYGATRTFDEVDPSTNPNNNFDNAYFDDDLVTKGMGVNVKLGAVFTPSQNLRLGLAVHTPTWYSLTDHYDAEAYANTENLPQNEGKNEAWSRPNQPAVYDYSLQTPYKLLGSLTYLFGDVNNVSSQKGLITADVEYVNHMASKFKAYDENGVADQNSYRRLNSAIDDSYKGAVNARLGAELKFNTIMARFGGAYYGNPYKNLAGEKGNIYQGSAGVGYRNHGFFVDLGYIYTAKDDVYYPYRLENKSAFDPATIKSNGSRVVLTLGFKI